ncbi:MAG: hydroxypyruvate isomerase family protein [Armatimonadota bacterium]
MKQALVWWSFVGSSDYSPEEIMSAAKQIGYDAMEMMKPEQIPMVKDQGLDVALLIGHDSLTDGMNDPENHSRIADELAESIQVAAQNDVPVLCCFSGNRRFGLSDMQGAEYCAEILSRMAPQAEKAGVTLCMELLNSKVNHAGYQCDNTEWGVHLCKMVNSPAVKLLYDVYHMQIMEGDLIRTITDNIEWIGHFHTGGNPGRNDIDETQEIFYPPIAKAIAESGYDGYVSHEYTPKGDTIDSAKAAWEIFDV